MLIRKLNISLYAVIMSLLLVSTVTFSATSEKMGLDGLVQHADRIVVGKCVNVISEWSNNKIYSRNTIEVTDSIKGDVVTSYVVTTLGGSAYHPGLKAVVTMDVSGGLIFSLNEDVILFTKQNILGQHQVVGMSQGKFNIRSEKKSGKKIIPIAEKKIYSEKLAKDILMSSAKTKLSVGEQIVIRKGKITLSDFVNRIKELVKNKSNSKSQK